MQQMQVIFNGDGTVVMSKEDFIKHFLNGKPIDQIVLSEKENNAVIPQVTSSNPDIEITAILSGIGIPRNIKGFNYIREAAQLCLQEKNYLERITKDLYPAVAIRFNTMSNRVERAIRHAIEVCWGDHAAKKLNMYCGSGFLPGHKKPTNSQFLALIVDSLLLQRKYVISNEAGGNHE